MTSSATRGSPPWAATIPLNLARARRSFRLRSNLLRASGIAAALAKRSISVPSWRQSSVRFWPLPLERQDGFLDFQGIAIPRPKGRFMSVTRATVAGPPGCRFAPWLWPAPLHPSSHFMNAPEPTFTSSTKPSASAAIFLPMMDEAIKGMDSTVAVHPQRVEQFVRGPVPRFGLTTLHSDGVHLVDELLGS